MRIQAAIETFAQATVRRRPVIPQTAEARHRLIAHFGVGVAFEGGSRLPPSCQPLLSCPESIILDVETLLQLLGTPESSKQAFSAPSGGGLRWSSVMLLGFMQLKARDRRQGPLFRRAM